jgi:beta-galactosidase
MLAANSAATERFTHFYKSDFDARDFRQIAVPSNWAMQGFEEPSYDRAAGAEGFYLRRFHAPSSLVDKRVLLHFEGVWDSAEVWLNGEALGRHDSGFTGFAFDVTSFLKLNAENTLAVRVRQQTKDSSFDENDDWALGGIYRDVWLEFMPRELYIDRIEAVTDLDDQFRDADLRLRLLITRRDENDKRLMEVRAILTAGDGRETQRASFTSAIADLINHVRELNTRDVLLEMHVRGPSLWTAETPNLYHLRVELLVDGHITHERSESIGFREISTTGGVLRVNGQPVKLRGVCRHDEHPEVGRATRREHWLEDIKLMKAANINAVRTSHYPPNEGFLRLCDEMGLYVIDEVPMGHGGDLLHDPSLASGALLRAYETVARDRNHPSVIIWSIGNEDPVTNLHLAVIRFIKGMDPTRPVLMPINSDDRALPSEIDILAPHYRSAAEYEEIAARSQRPIITTEYTHALGDGGFGGLEDRWRALTGHPSGAGGMIWLWADQGLRRRVRNRTVLDPIRDLERYGLRTNELVRHSDAGPDEIYDAHGVFGSDGIVNPNRTPQRDYWETKAVYAPVAVSVSELAFKAAQQRISVPVRNDYDFLNLSSVKIHWTLFADDRELAAGDARLNTPPHTTTALELPTNRITKLETDTSYYVQLRFDRTDGSEIMRNSVRLVTDEIANAPNARGRQNLSSPQIAKRGSKIQVNAGAMRYEFDAQTAQLTSVAWGNRVFIKGAHPSIWRPLSLSEVFIYRRVPPQRPMPPDLDRYETNVKAWNVSESGTGVRIEAEADHRVDEKNWFTARYVYLIDADGSLKVEYSIRPQVELTWVPEAGMEFEVSAELNTLRWLGLGPLDAYPNEKAAAIFGVWSERAGSGGAQGVKAEVTWAELSNAKGAGFRVTGSPFIRLDGDGTKPARLHLLSAVVGRSAKFNPPERPEYRLDVNPGRTFTGRFTIVGLK